MAPGSDYSLVVVLPIPRKRRRRDVDYRVLAGSDSSSRNISGFQQTWSEDEPEPDTDDFSDLGSPGLEKRELPFNPFPDEPFLDDDLVPLPRLPLTAEELQQSELAKAHQKEVESAIDFLEDFSEGVVSYTGLEDRRLTWSAEQKSILVTLVTRRGVKALPTVSKRTGKSLIECQAYLDLLNAGCRTTDGVIDEECIPAAMEIPEEELESSVGSENEDFVGYCESNESGLINLAYILKKSRNIWLRGGIRCLQANADNLVRFYIKRILQTIVRTSRRRKDHRRWTVKAGDIRAAINMANETDPMMDEFVKESENFTLDQSDEIIYTDSSGYDIDNEVEEDCNDTP